MSNVAEQQVEAIAAADQNAAVPITTAPTTARSRGFKTLGWFGLLGVLAVALQRTFPWTGWSAEVGSTIHLFLAIIAVSSWLWVLWPDLDQLYADARSLRLSAWLCCLAAVVTQSLTAIFLATTKAPEMMGFGAWDLVPLTVLGLEAFRLGYTRLTRPLFRHFSLTAPSRGVGSRYRIKVGDTLTDDVVVISGSCVIAQPPFAPLASRASVDEGDPILAASRVLAGDAEVEVTASAGNSVIFLRESEAKSAYRSSPGLTTEWESVTVFAIFCVAAGAAIFWGEQSESAFRISRIATAVLLLAQGILVWKLMRGFRDRIVWTEWMRGVWFPSFDAAERFSGASRLIWCSSPGSPVGRPQVVSVELFDDRVDRVALLQVMFDLASRGQSPWLMTLGDYCASVLGTQLRASRMIDIREYEGGQVSARLQGVDFSLGDESFVLARGVQLQGNETGIDEGMRPGDRILLLALNRDVIGRVILRWDAREQVAHLPQRGGFDHVEALELMEPSLASLQEKDFSETVVVTPVGTLIGAGARTGDSGVYGLVRTLGDQADPSSIENRDIEIWAADPIAALVASRFAVARSIARYYLKANLSALIGSGVAAGAIIGWIPAPFISVAFLLAIFVLRGREM